ncbi:MFS transporter [Paenibacillus alginolyticus]|uniref:MFS transporter n=1 Tax=Paenibacillus alginolyticus TaxID=59839 RepID=A0ABT4GL45_9BACL|nr:MFS transporter [Paenibacillus alginolyticus]MCY9669662.1 MFS transporter [Paenibacillus alginolyticus]MCY9696929.1 MFS transporter [Paenibacillus alginolyticus]MEC0145525.1 MFS transporter [Paenibacillus alginolyticus]
MHRIPLFSLISKYDTAIWVRVVGTILTSLAGFMMRPYLVYYLYDKLDGSIFLSMLIIGLQPLCGIFVNLYAGSLSDRYGRKPMMLAALIIQAFAIGGYMFASHVWEFAVISIINGIGHAMYGPAANAQITDVVPQEKRAEVFALLHTALNMGSAFGPLLGLLLFTWNPTIIFLTCSVALLAYAGLVVWKVPETMPEKSASELELYKTKPKIKWRDHKPLLWITLLAMPVSLLYAQVESTFPLHLQQHFENYKTVFATIITFNGCVVIAMQIWIAKRTEHVSAYLVVAASYLLFAIVSVGYGFVPIFAILLFVEFLFTIGEMLNGPHIQKVISVIAPEEHRGWYFSVFGMNWQLSRAIGPILGGLLFSHFGGKVMFAVLSAIILLAGIAQSRYIRSLNHKKEEPIIEAALQT